MFLLDDDRHKQPKHVVEDTSMHSVESVVSF